PCNAVTGHAYRGVNLLLLWTTRLKGWQQPRFLSYRQALEAGGHVRKGEHGKHIVYVGSAIDKNSKDEDDPRSFRFLKHFTVFNIAQCEGLPGTLTAPPKAPNPDQRDALIDEFIAAIGAKIYENDIENAAYYTNNIDTITMPAFKFFRGRAEYYATLFHELVHWTKHATRLDRQLGKRFGLRAEAAEELIPE